jgi:peptide/nickel transport system permease protein
MLGYVIRRVLFAIPIALGVSVVCFSLTYLAPGDPLQTLLPTDATAETIAIVKHAYGFDRPIPVQYAFWLWHVLHGDFGRSIASQRAVTLEVFGSLGNTAMLALFTVPLSFSVGAGMGALAGCFPGRVTDRIVTGAAVIGVSLPNYWLGLVLVIIFAVEFMVLPASGMGQSGSAAFTLWHWSDAQFLVLPVTTLAMIPIGIIARTTRAAVAEVRSQDFVTTLRAMGLGEGAVIRHVLKNASPQVLAVMGLQFGYLMGGSILVETVFTWPGSGFLLFKAIINRDIPVLQGTILALSLIFVATNLVVDLLQAVLDPRIRRA